MKQIEIDTYFGDKPVHFEISAPHGAVTFNVMINKFYNGSLVKAYDGWRINLHRTTILQGDDVAVIIELIGTSLNSKIKNSL